MITIRQLPSGHLSAWHEGKMLPTAISGASAGGSVELTLPVAQSQLGTKVDRAELPDHVEALKAALVCVDDLEDAMRQSLPPQPQAF
jgi:hypothetical protein